MTINESVELITNIALTLSFVVALVFGIAQVKAASRDRQERLTLETLRSFQTNEFSTLLFYIINTQMPSTEKGMKALPANEQIMIIQYAQQMESLGILVAEKHISIDLVDKTLGSFVTTSWNKYKPMFQDVREKAPDPFLAEYFQWLAERIDERMQKSPRKPFYKTEKL